MRHINELSRCVKRAYSDLPSHIVMTEEYKKQLIYEFTSMASIAIQNAADINTFMELRILISEDVGDFLIVKEIG